MFAINQDRTLTSQAKRAGSPQNAGYNGIAATDSLLSGLQLELQPVQLNSSAHELQFHILLAKSLSEGRFSTKPIYAPGVTLQGSMEVERGLLTGQSGAHGRYCSVI
jgi:hypothetical protein